MSPQPFNHLLIVLAHPDDAEILCFGTIKKFIEQGSRVSLVIVCAGDTGLSIAEQESRGSKKIDNTLRYEETVAAFAGSGVEIQCLGFTDGELQLNTALISAIEKAMSMINPDALITHFIDYGGTEHQNHTTVGRAAINAAVRTRSLRLILHPEPLSKRALFTPNYFVDITRHFAAKVEALSKHKTQAGRPYLTSDYHYARCRYNASRLGLDAPSGGPLFESFYSYLYIDS